jgi:hypothetical protein
MTATRAEKRRALVAGPIGWRNWRALELGTRRSMDGYEIALHSDSRFIDELLDLGPYRLFNTVANGAPVAGQTTLALVLRVAQYGTSYIDLLASMQGEGTHGSHHGGWLGDEIAALVSLALGTRCQAGEITRRFHGTRDAGTPTQWQRTSPWPVAVNTSAGPILPNVVGTFNLADARDLLKSYPKLSVTEASALVRAARQFQQALLVAETDANTAWLLLVSAVEVAAVHHVTRELDDWETLVSAWPDLATELRRLKRERRDRVAAMLARQVKAGRRYRQFFRDFCPSPPTNRPVASYAIVRWNKSSLTKAINKIYDHRSLALHEGVPFPSPMCWAPDRSDDKVADERPWSMGVGSGDAYWPGSELPMHLHTFVHAAGDALRQWWASMAS